MGEGRKGNKILGVSMWEDSFSFRRKILLYTFICVKQRKEKDTK